VPWLQAVALQLDAGASHLEGVLVKFAVSVPDEAEAEQGLQERHAGPRLRPQLFLAEPACFVLQFRGQLVRDDPRGDGNPGRKVLGPFAPVDGVKVVLDDIQGQVLVTLKGQDEAEPFDVAVGVLPVSRGCTPGIDESFFLKEPDFRRRHARKVIAQLSEHFPDVQDQWSPALRLCHCHRQPLRIRRVLLRGQGSGRR
jgi:hypothetical protein